MCIVGKFLFAKYLKGDAKNETIFLHLEGHLEKNVLFGNITTGDTNDVPAIFHCY